MSFPFKLPMLLDGATGTNLQKAGMPGGVCTEKWILENPQPLIDLKRSYVEAGSDAIYAPTFGVNSANLKKYGIIDSVYDMCSRLVELARKDVGVSGDLLLGGDMAPCGLSPEPFGEASIGQLVDIYAEQAQALEKNEVDFFIIETQIYLEDTKAAVTAVKSVSDRPVFVSFACNEVGRSFWGDDLAQAVTVLEPMGIDAYGINCCGDLALLERLVGEIRANTALPIIAKPNAGLPVVRDRKTCYDMTPEQLAERIPAIRAAGADMFGGCCGTDARHIAAIKAALE